MLCNGVLGMQYLSVYGAGVFFLHECQSYSATWPRCSCDAPLTLCVGWDRTTVMVIMTLTSDEYLTTYLTP